MYLCSGGTNSLDFTSVCEYYWSWLTGIWGLLDSLSPIIYYIGWGKNNRQNINQSKITPKLIYFTPYFLFLKACYLTLLTAVGAFIFFIGIIANKGQSSANIVSFLFPLHDGMWMQLSREPWPPWPSLSRRINCSSGLPSRSTYLMLILFFCVKSIIYLNCMMFVKTMLNIAFWIDHINNFVDLVGKGTTKWNNFIILAHLMQKMLWIWSENKGFWFFCSMAKQLQNINN